MTLPARIAVGAPDACWPWTGPTRNGYGYDDRRVNGVRRARRAHRMAWAAVHGDIPEGMDVLHACDNPPCCNPRHLFLGTDADNAADRNAKGRQARGEGNGRAKLTAADVATIRAASGPHTALAREHGVSAWTIAAIRRRFRWAHLESAGAVNTPTAADVGCAR